MFKKNMKEGNYYSVACYTIGITKEGVLIEESIKREIIFKSLQFLMGLLTMSLFVFLLEIISPAVKDLLTEGENLLSKQGDILIFILVTFTFLEVVIITTGKMRSILLNFSIVFYIALALTNIVTIYPYISNNAKAMLIISLFVSYIYKMTRDLWFLITFKKGGKGVKRIFQSSFLFSIKDDLSVDKSTLLLIFKFKLYQGNQNLGTYTSDKFGTVLLPNLESGKYQMYFENEIPVYNNQGKEIAFLWIDY